MIEVQVPLEGRFYEQARLGLATRAMVALVVRADQDVIQWKSAAQQIMHPVEVAARLITAGKSGLVGRDDEHEPGRLEFFQLRFGRLDHFEFFQRQRRDLMLRSGPNLIEDGITFDKYSSLHTC